MSLTFWVGRKRFEVGSIGFLKAFFSTVFVRLEGERWGERFPVIMRELYSGRLASAQSAPARDELRMIRTGLARLDPDQVVWDFEDRAALPPGGAELGADVKTLADYFVTSDGEDFLEVLERALAETQRSGKDLEVS